MSSDSSSCGTSLKPSNPFKPIHALWWRAPMVANAWLQRPLALPRSLLVILAPSTLKWLVHRINDTLPLCYKAISRWQELLYESSVYLFTPAFKPTLRLPLQQQWNGSLPLIRFLDFSILYLKNEYLQITSIACTQNIVILYAWQSAQLMYFFMWCIL